MRGKTILVVEDNPDNMLSITAILDGIGCNYVMAEDGRQAIEAVKKSPPTLILMDIHLPRMSGLEATRQIKADPDTADIPIIALTAKAMKGDREDILAAGCDEYLSKPIEPQKLIETVQKWIGG
ncbi:MAG: response regulator [Candidatus Abyssubacteria bacterium]|nr:response regulator [Candidatus Abyssubacteria bacterium]